MIINSEKNNYIEKKYFYNKIEKNYNNKTYTSIISHKKTNNNTARQIFTKFGPIAYLPISLTRTSVVFSSSEKYKFLSNKSLKNYLKNYNQNYQKVVFGKIESFELSFLSSKKICF